MKNCERKIINYYITHNMVTPELLQAVENYSLKVRTLYRGLKYPKNKLAIKSAFYRK